MNATYKKLRDGSWGIRVTGGTPNTGTSITVRKADGSTNTVTVGPVIWSGNGVTICTVNSSGSKTSPRKPAYAPKASSRYGDCDDFCQGCRRCM